MTTPDPKAHKFRDTKGVAMTTKKKTPAKKTTKGPKVIVRTYSAGVHFGTLRERNGKEVILDGARRIWRWRGANTLSEIATKGLDAANSAIACAVNGHVLTEAIEIIPCSPEAAALIEGASAWKP
jgi:hypothetical protein